jgi:hypothetical protein
VSAYAAPGSPVSSWCLLEAVTSCAGETALVLWQIGIAFSVVMAVYPYSFSQPLRDRIMVGFHICFWGFAGGSTILAGSLGLLGQNGSPGDTTNYWCWFAPNLFWWEQGQVRAQQ